MDISPRGWVPISRDRRIYIYCDPERKGAMTRVAKVASVKDAAVRKALAGATEQVASSAWCFDWSPMPDEPDMVVSKLRVAR